MAFLVSSQAADPDSNSPANPPLDPLTPAEIEAAATAVTASQGLKPSWQATCQRHATEDQH